MRDTLERWRIPSSPSLWFCVLALSTNKKESASRGDSIDRYNRQITERQQLYMSRLDGHFQNEWKYSWSKNFSWTDEEKIAFCVHEEEEACFYSLIIQFIFSSNNVLLWRMLELWFVLLFLFPLGVSLIYYIVITEWFQYHIFYCSSADKSLNLF